MALTDLYLNSSKNLASFFTTILTAEAPQQFTIKFLESLGFKGSNDRLFVKMLKELKFVDSTGKPIQNYFEYLDQSQSKIVLARAIKTAYADLFQIDKKANELTLSQTKNKLKTLTQGSKSDLVYGRMATTFVDLCKQADFKSVQTATVQPDLDKSEPKAPGESNEPQASAALRLTGLHYNIQIHLPDTRDANVFDAIFQSMKRHLV